MGFAFAKPGVIRNQNIPIHVVFMVEFDSFGVRDINFLFYFTNGKVLDLGESPTDGEAKDYLPVGNVFFVNRVLSEST